MAAGALLISRLLRAAPAALAFALVLSSLPVSTGPASAQELIRRQTLFERLFGGPPRREALPPPRQQQRMPAQRNLRSGAPESQSRARRIAAPPEPEPPAVEKLDNALAILVIGDFMAGGLAEGLEEAYADSPGVRVVDRTNGSSGFVRDDFYDWNAEIGPILEEEKPAVAVVMIGSNDRQALTIDGRAERPRTEAWLKEYVRRVTAFAESIEAAGIPLVWTGVPPFKSSSMSSDMLAFNDIYSRAAEEAGGTFVDIWEGFVDENGTFTFTGPDMNGQPVRLRAGDGINLTRPAKRKIAFYVEKPLAKLLGPAIAPDVGQQEIANLPPPGTIIGIPAVDRTRTQPISLAGPELDGGSELLGGAGTPVTGTARPEVSVQPGRADDFSLRERNEPGEGTAAVRP